MVKAAKHRAKLGVALTGTGVVLSLSEQRGIRANRFGSPGTRPGFIGFGLRFFDSSDRTSKHNILGCVRSHAKYNLLATSYILLDPKLQQLIYNGERPVINPHHMPKALSPLAPPVRHVLSIFLERAPDTSVTVLGKPSHRLIQRFLRFRLGPRTRPVWAHGVFSADEPKGFAWEPCVEGIRS